MSRKELEIHQRKVERAHARKVAADAKVALAEATKAALVHLRPEEISLEDFAQHLLKRKAVRKKPKQKAHKAKGPQAKPKFANPANPKETWTGKGRQPNWYRAKIDKGASPEDMDYDTVVKAAKAANTGQPPLRAVG